VQAFVPKGIPSFFLGGADRVFIQESPIGFNLPRSLSRCESASPIGITFLTLGFFSGPLLDSRVRVRIEFFLFRGAAHFRTLPECSGLPVLAAPGSPVFGGSILRFSVFSGDPSLTMPFYRFQESESFGVRHTFFCVWHFFFVRLRLQRPVPQSVSGYL